MTTELPMDFGHPYKPYSIQVDFMRAVYETMTQGKIGIFESPTGTGKSLSLICGSLRWLKDQGDTLPSESTEPKMPGPASTDEPDWVKAFSSPQSAQNKKQIQQARKKRLHKRIDRARYSEKPLAYETLTREPKRAKKNDAPLGEDDEEFLLDEYSSDDDQQARKRPNDNTSNLSEKVQELLAKMDPPTVTEDTDDNLQPTEEEDDLEQYKIYYASRTHSQLSQFVHEIQKTVYADDTWLIPLGSRKTMCINKDVKKLSNVQRINEVCLEKQKPTSKTRCPHLPPLKERAVWDDFRDHALSKVRDIEDLVKMGDTYDTCPYYGSRHAVKAAQVVVLPYQHLLHASTRESLGVSLKNSIVIIDEAHNLIETINAIHTISLSTQQIRTAMQQLALYLQRYKKRLLGKNINYIRHIVTILKAVLQILESKKSEDDEAVLRINEFVHLLKIDHLNMYKIEKYLKASNLARKLNGFVDKLQQDPELYTKQASFVQKHKASSTPTLTQIETFIMTLTNPDKDGRIVLYYDEEEGPKVKYMLLNPAHVFQPIIQDARSIILAGGTMEPISDFLKFLFPGVPAERISRLSCGHIIPPTNMSVLSLAEGPSGKPLQFTFNNRGDVRLMDDVGLSILNLCNVIPDGVVCFFASFSYLEQLYARWKAADILPRIAKRKKIFKEPRENNKVDDTLRDYSLHIDTNQGGALLLCVVNGKMSEGINFSDRLGRGVIMIGLPFANSKSVELQEKMKFAKVHSETENMDAGKEYYENLCMRGVNQSIGRAIRHKTDYATIILMDARYNTRRIQDKLPGWIGSHVEHCDKFGKALGKTSQFFRQWRNAR